MLRRNGNERRLRAETGVRTGMVLSLASLSHIASALGAQQQPGTHPLANPHQPMFVTPPGETDVLLVIMALVLIVAVLAVGVFFFWLHSLPERLVHNSTKVHFDIVAALGLLSLFTHIHLFWVLALLIALVRIPTPDFSGLLGRIAGSLEKIAATPPASPGISPNGSAGIGLTDPIEPPRQRT